MTDDERKQRLIAIVHTYIHAVTARDFSLIPYAEDAQLRSPFTADGVRTQLRGRDVLYREWWIGLVLDPPERQVEFNIGDLYFNATLDAVVAEMVIVDHMIEPPVVLWAAERFTLNEAGEIIDQINHFDVRDAVTPGWQDQRGPT